MRSFERWEELQNLSGKAVLNHFLFGDSVYECDSLQVINNENKLGIIIKGRELFVYKDRVEYFCVSNNIYEAKDDLLDIKIIVNKL